jgi:hypothetical protein
MEYPVGEPTLEIRNVRLSMEDPGSDVLEPKPVVDQFGQWTQDDWPGKVKDLEQLKREWAEEEASLTAGDFNYCKYGGYRDSKAKATGFFRVEQVDGRWWLIDPDGHRFLSVGASGMGARSGGTRVQGRERYFSAMPPPDLAPTAPGRGGTPSNTRQVSFYAWNLFRRFGADWDVKWSELAARRMNSWGLNTGAGRTNKYWEENPKPYLMLIRDWQTGPAVMGVPDVDSKEFVQRVDEAAARQCEPRKNDPYLIGYYIGNEPPWPGRESDLVDLILAGPDNPTKQGLRKFLQDGDTAERRHAWAIEEYEKYLRIVNAAVKKHDPNHLNLGIRLANSMTSQPSDDVIRMGRLFDVNSQNIYHYDPTPILERAYRLAGRPILIGEFHNGFPGRGLAAGLVQVRDEKERGIAYQYYLEHAAASPAFVGASWFIFVDEPVTGRSDGENYNIGFVDVTDRPYPGLVAGLKAAHKRLDAVHSGKLEPFGQKPAVQ